MKLCTVVIFITKFHGDIQRAKGKVRVPPLPQEVLFAFDGYSVVVSEYGKDIAQAEAHEQ